MCEPFNTLPGELAFWQLDARFKHALFCMSADNTESHFDWRARFSAKDLEHQELKERNLALQEELRSTHQQLVEQSNISASLSEEKDLLLQRYMTSERLRLKEAVSFQWALNNLSVGNCTYGLEKANTWCTGVNKDKNTPAFQRETILWYAWQAAVCVGQHRAWLRLCVCWLGKIYRKQIPGYIAPLPQEFLSCNFCLISVCS